MKEWILARGATVCGKCSASIKAGMKALELTHGETRRYRCEPCGVHLFGEQPPADLVQVPQPSLPIQPIRRPDFVNAGHLARQHTVSDFRRRQAGESE